MGVTAKRVQHESGRVEQTRSVTWQLFTAELEAGSGCDAEPLSAYRRWRAGAEKAGDRGLVRVLEGLDLETFAATWTELREVLQLRGTAPMLEWLRTRSGLVAN